MGVHKYTLQVNVPVTWLDDMTLCDLNSTSLTKGIVLDMPPLLISDIDPLAQESAKVRVNGRDGIVSCSRLLQALPHFRPAVCHDVRSGENRD